MSTPRPRPAVPALWIRMSRRPWVDWIVVKPWSMEVSWAISRNWRAVEGSLDFGILLCLEPGPGFRPDVVGFGVVRAIFLTIP